MKARKLLSVLLSLVLVLGLLPASALAASYPDTQGHWAEDAIDRWSDYGIVTGDERGFRPNDNMTRAEAATVLSKLFKLQDTTANTFADVSASQWFYDAINKCYNAGILGGVGDNRMDPDGPLTRETFFVMFARGLGLKEQSSTSGLPADGNSWSTGLINALTDKGYVVGQDGKVNALANINRASVMSLLSQTIAQYINTSGEQTLEAGAAGKIALVVANNATLKGTTASDIVIAKGVNGGKATLDGVTAPVLIAAADNATVALTNKTAISDSLTVPGKNTTVTYSKDSTIPANATADGTGSKISAEGAVAGGAGGGGGGDTGKSASKSVQENISDTDYTDTGTNGGNGNLTIGADLGDGTIQLERVKAKKLYVSGGGSGTVKLIDCEFEEVIVDKPAKAGSETPRVYLDGSTTVPKLTATQPAILDAAGSQSVGTVTATSAVTIKGGAQVETVKTTKAAVTLASGYTGTVGTINASGSATVTANGGTIQAVTANNATIEGAGATIETVTASGKVSINADVETVTVPTKATITVGNNAAVSDVVANGTTTIEADPTGGSIGKVTATANVSVNAAKVTIDEVVTEDVKETTINDEGAEVITVKTKTTPTIAVTSGTVKAVTANSTGEGGTKISANDSAKIAEVTANSAVSVDAATVQKVTVATDEKITVTGSAAAGQKLDVAVATTGKVDIQADSTSETAFEVSAADGVTVNASNVTITTGTGKTATVKAVSHIHKWSDGTTTKEATCEEPGTVTYTCSAAGHEGGDKTETIPALGHKFSTEANSDLSKAATCVETGKAVYVCEHNGDHTKTVTLPIDPTAHTVAENATWVNVDAATEANKDTAKPKDATKHTYGDPLSHWQYCTLDDGKDEATHTHRANSEPHTFGDPKITSNDDGSFNWAYTCTGEHGCGYIKNVTVPAGQATLALAEGGNKLVNSNDRTFDASKLTVAVTFTNSNLQFSDDAAKAASWKVEGLKAAGLSTTFTVSVNSNTATLKFTPANAETPNVSGAIRITANAAAFKATTASSDVQPVDSTSLKVGIPAPAAVEIYGVSVDQYGTATVTKSTTTNGDDGETTTTETEVNDATLYLVDASMVAGKPLSKLANETYKTTTKEQVEKALGVDEKNENATAKQVTAETLKATKANNGKYLVAVAYSTETSSKDQLDAYGVSAAIAVKGDTPATLTPAVSATGAISVTEKDVTPTYYLVSAKPATNPDTLDNKNAVQSILGTAAAEGKTVADITADLKNATFIEIENAGETPLTSKNDGTYLVAVTYAKTDKAATEATEAAEATNPEFEGCVTAYGVVKVSLPGDVQFSILTDDVAKGSDEQNATVLYGKAPSDLVSADTVATAGADGKTIKVTGTAYKITDWTEFSSISGEENGHYLPIRIVAPAGQTRTEGTTVTVTGSKAKTFTGANAFFGEEDNEAWLVMRFESLNKENTITVAVNWDGEGADGAVTYTIDVSGVTKLELGDVTDVVAAPLVDHASTPIDSKALGTVTLSIGSPTTDGTTTTVPVTLKASGLVEHTNANSQKGYWVGIGIPKLDGATYAAGWGAAPAASAEFAATNNTSEFTDNNVTYVTFYANAKSTSDAAKTAGGVWFVAEKIGGNTVVYKITNTVTTLDDVIDEGIEEVNEKLVDGNEAYAELKRGTGGDAKTITVDIKDGTVDVGTVYDDIITTLVTKVNAYASDLGLTKIEGTNKTGDKSGTAQTLTLSSEVGNTEIVKFVKDLGLIENIKGSTKIAGLNGVTVELKMMNDSTAKDTYTLKFVFDFDKALDAAIDAAASTINAAINTYGSVALTKNTNAVAVTITDGKTQIGTVYQAVAEKLVKALTDFGTSYGTVTLTDAKSSSDPATLKSNKTDLSNGDIAGFVKALKTGSESEETLGTLLTNNAAISTLNGKSVQIKVTGTGYPTDGYTYDFTFTVQNAAENPKQQTLDSAGDTDTEDTGEASTSAAAETESGQTTEEGESAAETETTAEPEETVETTETETTAEAAEDE